MFKNNIIASKKFKFIADCMLGSLARWLRLLGFDTLYFHEADDEFLVNVARNEKRILITRDAGIHYPELILIKSTRLVEQVSTVLNNIGVEQVILDPLHSRCPHCNAMIKPVKKNAIKNIVPENVYNNINNFFRCTGSSCGQVYWIGGHWNNLNKQIIQINSLLSNEKNLV